ncbi:MAG: hypothetical protein JNL75_00160 [Chitinophagales bacterium]|nr:hypothetical protein [Chitinophagales bacterium]
MKKFIIIICSIVLFQSGYSQAQAAGGGGHTEGIWLGCFDWRICLPFPKECRMGSVSNFSWENNRFILSLDLSTYAEDVQQYFEQNTSFTLTNLPQEGITVPLNESLRTLSGRESFTFLNGSYLFTREENIVKIQF